MYRLINKTCFHLSRRFSVLIWRNCTCKRVTTQQAIARDKRAQRQNEPGDWVAAAVITPADCAPGCSLTRNWKLVTFSSRVNCHRQRNATGRNQVQHTYFRLTYLDIVLITLHLMNLLSFMSRKMQTWWEESPETAKSLTCHNIRVPLAFSYLLWKRKINWLGPEKSFWVICSFLARMRRSSQIRASIRFGHEDRGGQLRNPGSVNHLGQLCWLVEDPTPCTCGCLSFRTRCWLSSANSNGLALLGRTGQGGH